MVVAIENNYSFHDIVDYVYRYFEQGRIPYDRYLDKSKSNQVHYLSILVPLLAVVTLGVLLRIDMQVKLVVITFSFFVILGIMFLLEDYIIAVRYQKFNKKYIKLCLDKVNDCSDICNLLRDMCGDSLSFLVNKIKNYNTLIESNLIELDGVDLVWDDYKITPNSTVITDSISKVTVSFDDDLNIILRKPSRR